MKYKLPTGGEKRRVLRALDNHVSTLYFKALRANKNGKIPGRLRPVKVVFNPFSGRFRVTRTVSKPRKNEICVVESFPDADYLEHLQTNNVERCLWYPAAVMRDTFAVGFLNAARGLFARGSHWSPYWLAAERILEIANERRATYDD